MPSGSLLKTTSRLLNLKMERTHALRRREKVVTMTKTAKRAVITVIGMLKRVKAIKMEREATRKTKRKQRKKTEGSGNATPLGRSGQVSRLRLQVTRGPTAIVRTQTMMMCDSSLIMMGAVEIVIIANLGGRGWGGNIVLWARKPWVRSRMATGASSRSIGCGL